MFQDSWSWDILNEVDNGLSDVDQEEYDDDLEEEGHLLSFGEGVAMDDEGFMIARRSDKPSFAASFMYL